MLCCKLPRDVDCGAYRRQCPCHAVTGLPDAGESRVQVDDKFGGPAKFARESIAQKTQRLVDVRRGRQGLLVRFFRSDCYAEKSGYPIAQELDRDPTCVSHRVANRLAVAVENVQKVLR